MLFVDGAFTAHSGSTLPFKIDCDALTDADLDTLARWYAAADRNAYCTTIGVPRGGVRFEQALRRHLRYDVTGYTLLVDDVLTTGASISACRGRDKSCFRGVVIFARGPCPWWVTPLFTAMRGPEHLRPSTAA